MRGVLALAAGSLFGIGLFVSGMIDPAKVRAFLDVGGAWDPTLGFVMAGAIAPMAAAWRIAARIDRPLAAARFDLPRPAKPDLRLVAGAALFGVGWGLAGLCPGPAVANLVLHPLPSSGFVLAMLAGMALHGAQALYRSRRVRDRLTNRRARLPRDR